jgi:hypothetical protein
LNLAKDVLNRGFLSSTNGSETEDLLNLGAAFLRALTPRKIEIGNCIYTEGGLDSLIEMSLNIKH